MTKVSIYPKIKETVNGEECDLFDIFDAIASGHWADTLKPLHEAVKNNADPKRITELKAELPYFTGGGTFSVRNEKGLKQHSGRLIMDFDKLEDVAASKELISRDPFTEVVFLSCTGRGFAVVVKIDPLKHIESFLYLEKYYMDKYALRIDKSCKDVSRPRFISYDPNIYINRNAAQVIVPTAEINSDEEKYEWVVRVHNKKQTYIEGNRHNYLIILCFFLNKCGVDYEYALYKVINDYSNAEKTVEEITKIITYCYNNTQDFGTFRIINRNAELPPGHVDAIKKIYVFAHKCNHAGRPYTKEDITSMCSEHLLSVEIVTDIFKNVYEKHADEYNIDNKAEIARVEMFIRKRFVIKVNEVTNRTTCIDKETGEPRTADDISRELQHANFKYPLDRIKSLLRTAFIEKYHPFKDYFESLPEWKDGDPDYITMLSTYVKTSDQDFWATQFKKALVRMIACAIDNQENRIVMVLVGEKQETGKTSFVRFLCPPALRTYFKEDQITDDKDSAIQLAEKFIWLLDELDALSKVEIGKLKSIISKKVVDQRRSYGEFSESMQRRVSFWAATNKAGFLTDTENTRWLCFDIKSIDHNYNNTLTNRRDVDIDKVWSQAYALYHLGFAYALTEDEKSIRDTTNREFEQSYTEKELIQTYFIPSPIGVGEWMTCTQILIELQDRTNQKVRISPYSIGKAMKQLGFEGQHRKVNGKTIFVYWLERAAIMLGDNKPVLDKEETKTINKSNHKPF